MVAWVMFELGLYRYKILYANISIKRNGTDPRPAQWIPRLFLLLGSSSSKRRRYRYTATICPSGVGGMIMIVIVRTDSNFLPLSVKNDFGSGGSVRRRRRRSLVR